MSAAINEQTIAIAQINTLVADIDNLTKENLEVANQTNKATNEVDEIADQIVKRSLKEILTFVLASQLGLFVKTFLQHF
ncbi:hypothetical protein VB002_09835 [Campylobacter concisus]